MAATWRLLSFNTSGSPHACWLRIRRRSSRRRIKSRCRRSRRATRGGSQCMHRQVPARDSQRSRLPHLSHGIGSMVFSCIHVSRSSVSSSWGSGAVSWATIRESASASSTTAEASSCVRPSSHWTRSHAHLQRKGSASAITLSGGNAATGSTTDNAKATVQLGARLSWSVCPRVVPRDNLLGPILNVRVSNRLISLVTRAMVCP